MTRQRRTRYDGRGPSRLVAIRFTADEIAELKRHLESEGETISSWIRRHALDPLGEEWTCAGCHRVVRIKGDPPADGLCSDDCARSVQRDPSGPGGP